MDSKTSLKKRVHLSDGLFVVIVVQRLTKNFLIFILLDLIGLILDNACYV